MVLYHREVFSHIKRYWPLLRRQWAKLFLLPFINITLVVIFWQSQLNHYTHSTKGVLLLWLVAGLIFVLIQMSLQANAWRQVTSYGQQQSAGERFETLWMLGSQLAMFGLATLYNVVALVQLILLGVRPNQPFDIIIAVILVATLVVACAVYGIKRLGSPSSRLLLATGTKAAPQWLQAVWFALQGSAGMHVATITSITAMGTTRYMLTRITLRRFTDSNTIAANKAAFRDLLSIIAMAAGWVLGRL